MTDRPVFRSIGALLLCVVLHCAVAQAQNSASAAPGSRSASAAGQENSSAQPSNQVRGKLLDPEGLSVPDVPVTIRSVLSGISKVARTSVDGGFVFDGVAAGSYVLTATANGLVLSPRQVEVKTGEAANVGELRMSLVAAQEQVIVSGSRVSELQEDAPTKVLSISKQQIQDTGYERVADVLSEVPGVVTRAQSYNVGLVGGEQIDGMDSKETAVLLDGLPFVGARGIDEGYIDLNQQDVGKVDRVEVVKGAASALYGTDALGGVINLISHQPTQPFELDASTSGGTLGRVDGRLGIGGQWSKLDAYLDLEQHRRDSYTLIPDNPSTVGPNENRQDLLAKLRYNFSPKASIAFTSTAYRNHLNGLGTTAGIDPSDPSNYTETPTSLRENDSNQTYALIGSFTPTLSTALQVRGYSSQYNEDSGSRLIQDRVEGPDFDPGTLREIYRRADATISQQWGSRQFLQGGYEFAWDQYSGDNRIVGGNAGQELTTHDLWVQDRIQPFHNLLLTLGARYQNNSSYGGHAVPKVGVVYRFNNHFVVRGAFGLGFRAPNLGELYYHLLHLEYAYQVIGNPTLKPETSQTYSAGGTYAAGRYTVSLNLFRNNLKELINTALICDATTGQDCSDGALVQLLSQYGVPQSFDYDDTGAALFTYLNLNVDHAYTTGVDLDGRVAITPSLAFSGAYTYLEAVDSGTHTWLPYRNRHQGHITLQYTKPSLGLTANIRGTFFSSWPLGDDTGMATGDNAFGYQIWNFYTSKSLYRGLRVFGAIDNLADSRDKKLSQAQPSYDRPDYGRMFRIGLNYTFPRRER